MTRQEAIHQTIMRYVGACASHDQNAARCHLATLGQLRGEVIGPWRRASDKAVTS